MNRYLKNVAVRRVVAMGLLAAAWEGLSRIGVINPFYAPAPSEIMRVVCFTVHRRNDLQPFGSHFRCRAGWTGDWARARDFSRFRRGAGSSWLPTCSSRS